MTYRMILKEINLSAEFLIGELKEELDLFPILGKRLFFVKAGGVRMLVELLQKCDG